MEKHQTYLISCSVVRCSSPLQSYFFFRFDTHISIALMIFMLNYAFTHILFLLRILLLAVEMSDRQALRSQARKNCCHGPYTAHVTLKVREEDAVNDVLFASLSNYREGACKLTGISNKTISRVKADSEPAVLAPQKP